MPLKNVQENNNEREVTDPVTHLPLLVHDQVSVELEQISPHPSNIQQKPFSDHLVHEEQADSNRRHATLEQVVGQEINRGRWHEVHDIERKTRARTAVVATGATAICGPIGLWTLSFWSRILGRGGFGWFELCLGTLGCFVMALGVGACVLVFSLEGGRSQETVNPGAEGDKLQQANSKKAPNEAPESAAWLNSLLHSLWPIINPTLFTSVSDMLEDALQASLPKLVHGVRVADIGQGSEPIRILGIRWLEAGMAGQEKDGMKAEEGDFINLEVAFAYRTSALQGSGLKSRSGNAHLLMEFLIAGGIIIPVWVELTGLISTARMRIQLTPNPPFLSVMTLTLLGQPKVTMVCTPLAKNFLNVMDVPGLSSWLQRSIDSAVSEFVAPRSLTLDLKTLLMGKEKMDTDALGVVLITVRSAKDFKQGDDANIFKSKDNRSGDAYVTAGWSKWGKPLWSTRIIKCDGNPIWEETTALIVGPAEVNAQESLRLQLWDSDRTTADDLLGTVDVPLKELMTKSENTFSARTDALLILGSSQHHGTLSWECGFFAKTTLEQHLEGRPVNTQEIIKDVKVKAENKLREAKTRTNETAEIKRQQREDLKEKTEEVIAGSNPTEDWPSGILALRIQQIDGLEVQKIRESGVKEDGEDEQSGDLPSAYCTVIINHQRVYKTRTKMKSDKPFFNASTEKFIRDWRNTVVIIAVRDARMHEIDPLLGIVALPLHTLLKHRSYINNSFPLVGGIGYGRLRLSLIFRSIQVRLPTRLLGWDLGTLDIHPCVDPSLDLPADLASCRLVFRTLDAKGKMTSHQDGGWRSRSDRNVRLAVRRRYSSCLLIQFRKHAFGPDKTLAFATLWLKDIPDRQEVHVTLAVRKNENGELERARSNSSGEIGERVGEIKMKLRLWPGLSGYHHYVADHDLSMADVMEVLDCAEESKEVNRDMLFDEDADPSTDTDSSEDEENEGGANDNEIKDQEESAFSAYRKKKGQLHRKHRGLMQWQPARNLAWAGRGIENTADKVGQKITGVFKHHDREIGIEKEV